MTTKSDKVRMKVAVLLGQTDPPLAHAKIAEMAGCSKKTVQRIARSIKPELEEVEAKLEVYRTLLRKHLPVEYRARRLRELVEQGDQQMVALKALERADAIDGLLRPPEQQDSARQGLFTLPAGTELRLVAQVRGADAVAGLRAARGADRKELGEEGSRDS